MSNREPLSSNSNSLYKVGLQRQKGRLSLIADALR